MGEKTTDIMARRAANLAFQRAMIYYDRGDIHHTKQMLAMVLLHDKTYDAARVLLKSLTDGDEESG